MIRWGNIKRAFVAWLLLAALPAAAEAAPTATVHDARAWRHPDFTRFVIELSAPVPYETFTLADPYRFVIDLPEVAFALEPTVVQGPVGVVTDVRYGQFKPGVSRLVLDLAGPAAVHRRFQLPADESRGHRLVVDLTVTNDAAFRATVRGAAPAQGEPERAAERSVRQERRDRLRNAGIVDLPPPPIPPRNLSDMRRTIVIDPGHGGIDPGAISVSGVYEKHVALDAARQLREALRATGRYRVVMTRDDDMFLRLRERVARARAAHADAFVSIHADAMPDPDHRGASVYTLSETASDAEAAALAAKENKVDIVAGVDFSDKSPEVANILIDLAQRATNNQSARMARGLVEEFRQAGVRIISKPHRQAGFRVLKSPDVPSILVELGYLSNDDDERLLVDPDAREKTILAIVRALDRYFETVTARSW